jgi:fatty acid desaturase
VADRHDAITLAMLAETVGIFVGLAAAAVALHRWDTPAARVLLAGVIVAQGCWYHRLYTAGHEAVHGKLFPGRPRLNDLVGQGLLLPILVPMRVYRKIHAFHHGCNRRDEHTAALDTWVIPAGAGPIVRLRIRVVWLAGILLGGFFVHGLVSIVLFLCLPQTLARRVSPAFKGWRTRDQLASAAVFAGGITLHVALAGILGPADWALAFAWPLVAFAWVYSLLVYVYHYGATYGRDVRYNVRSLPRIPVFSWWLLNFNEHATHHRDTSVPWYALPGARQPLPAAFARNEDAATLWQAIAHQLRGPRIVERDG